VIICLLNTLNNNNNNDDDDDDDDNNNNNNEMKKRKGRKPPKCTQLKFYEVMAVPMLNSYCENCTLGRSSVKQRSWQVRFRY
jgi:hypothetical protein